MITTFRVFSTYHFRKSKASLFNGSLQNSPLQSQETPIETSRYLYTWQRLSFKFNTNLPRVRLQETSLPPSLTVPRQVIRKYYLIAIVQDEKLFAPLLHSKGFGFLGVAYTHTSYNNPGDGWRVGQFISKSWLLYFFFIPRSYSTRCYAT